VSSPIPAPATVVSIDVVIVTHRSAELITTCLDSIVTSTHHLVFETITVIDSAANSSSDAATTSATATAIAQWNRKHANVAASFIALGTNVGFGAAVNRGVARGRAPFVAILNPDIEVDDECLDRLVGALGADARLAAVGPTVLNPDGSVYPSARTFPSLLDAAGHAIVGVFTPNNPFTRRYVGDPTRPDWISGTAMVVRREAFDTIGGFDESYFMYVEDVDLCWRWSTAGRTVALVDSARLTHLIGGSSATAPFRMIAAHHRSLWRFASRRPGALNRITLPLVFVGLITRAALVGLRQGIRRAPAATLHRRS
jgi:N-acetylglucosaminyl-diphospho-decaprenol L-rhamnosyltransferase